MSFDGFVEFLLAAAGYEDVSAFFHEELSCRKRSMSLMLQR